MAAASSGVDRAFDLLPSNEDEFRSKSYWDRFFSKRSAAFEWYGEWRDLKAPITRLFPKSTHVVVIGCGNSALSEQMYDDGFHDVLSLDYSDQVIRKQEQRSKSRKGMTWIVADARRTGLEGGKAGIVLDKGTLDAMLPSPSDEALSDSRQMLAESARICQVGGAYVCVSLLQSHVLEHLAACLGSAWECHLAPIQPEKPSSLCPFLLVAFKVHDEEAAAATHVPTTGDAEGGLSSPWWFHGTTEGIRSMSHSEKGPEGVEEEKVTSLKQLHRLVIGAAWHHRIKMQLQAITPGQRVSFDMWSAGDDSSPRFTLTAVDSGSGPCAAVVIPRGREAEWAFSTAEGQQDLARRAKMGRLVFVRCNRGHSFGSEAEVRDEVTQSVLRAAPADAKGSVAWMGIASDDDIVVTVAEVESEASGRMVVEDVPDPSAPSPASSSSSSSSASASSGSGGRGEDGLGYPRLRRLVFFSNQGAVQSEARLVGPTRPKKRHKAGQTVASSDTGSSGSVPSILLPSFLPPPAPAVVLPSVDYSYISLEYQSAVVACLAIPAAQAAARAALALASGAPEAPQATGSDHTFDVLVLGLGGGALPMFLHRAFGTGSVPMMLPPALAKACVADEGGEACESKDSWLEPQFGEAYGVADASCLITAASSVESGTAATTTMPAEAIPRLGASSSLPNGSKLHLVPPPLRVHTVELDEAVASVARDYFGFSPREEGNKCVLTVGDGLEHVEARAQQCKDAGDNRPCEWRLDALIVDVDAKELISGLSFPPKAFVDPSFLAQARACLKPGGCVIFNVACRDRSGLERILADISAAFDWAMQLQVGEGSLNMLLVAGTSPKEVDIGSICKPLMPLPADDRSLGDAVAMLLANKAPKSSGAQFAVARGSSACSMAGVQMDEFVTWAKRLRWLKSPAAVGALFTGGVTPAATRAPNPSGKPKTSKGKRKPKKGKGKRK